jgi:hypothetical protein
MTELVIVALATACVLTAVEELIITLGKWRGLLALIMGSLGSYFTLQHGWGLIIFTALASSFTGMTASLLVADLIESRNPRTLRGLPRRIPPL